MIKYAIITPVRNEETYVRKTIESVISQTVKPVQWVIVNDGSTDKTSQIIEEYQKKHNWIKRVDLEDRGFRAGSGPAEAFNEGILHIQTDYDFMVNLDGDVSFTPDYFELIFAKFNNNPKLGIASGKSYYIRNNKLVLYRCSDASTMGPLKTYRKQCFQDIGSSLVPDIAWDMVDDLRAKMHGWDTISFRDITFVHHKEIGLRQKNMLKAYFRQGRILYSYGYHPIFLLAKSVYRGFEKPYFIKSIGIITGYMYAFFKKEPQIGDKEMIKFLRKQQVELMFYKFIK